MIVDSSESVKECNKCQVAVPSCQKFCHHCSLELGYNEYAKYFYELEKNEN